MEEQETQAVENSHLHFIKGQVHDGPLVYPGEPARFTRRDIEPFFVWSAEQGASDISIQTGENIFLEVHGKKLRVTKRKMTQAEVMDIVVALFDSTSATGALAGTSPLDFAYVARPSRTGRYRFRINATALEYDGARGVQITARIITAKPPTFDELQIEEEIRRAFCPDEGLILITGATGSGKSTLLAAGIRGLAEDPDSHLKIITYEAPIEYVYDDLVKPTTLISQHEIHKHLPDFVESLRNALRRAPDIILLGEARDAETIGEAIRASMTGHLVYSTVHSNGFVDTIPRMVSAFPEGSRNSMMTDIISNLRMVVSQKLVPATDGRRVALREYVIFNDEIVEILLNGGVDNLAASSRRVLIDHGRSFLKDAKQKLAEGRISQKTYATVARGAKGEAADATEVIRSHLRKAQAALPGSQSWQSDLSLPDVPDGSDPLGFEEQ